jgi:hypothetical protein
MPVIQYAVTGFANIGMEWKQEIFMDKNNIDEIRSVINRTAALSYKLSIISIVGLFYGTLLTWINHWIAKRRIAKYEKSVNGRGA